MRPWSPFISWLRDRTGLSMPPLWSLGRWIILLYKPPATPRLAFAAQQSATCPTMAFLLPLARWSAFVACRFSQRPHMARQAVEYHRLLPAIAKTSPAGWFGPCVGGVELKAEPEAYAAVGRIKPVVPKAILGTNQNEGRFEMPFNSPVPNAPISSLADVKRIFGK